MADDKKAKKVKSEPVDAGDESTGGGSVKALLIGLGIAVLLAGGGFAYLQFVRKPEIQRQLTVSRRVIREVKAKGERLALEIDRISRDKLDKVSVLPEVINKVAEPGSTIAKSIKTGTQLSSRWKQTNYLENRCQVTFTEKTGYEWVGLNRFLKNIERANPKIQIKSINFGDRIPRRDGDTIDYWQPYDMTVRAFTPRSQ